jgi:gamma-glutamyltranspeptidase
MARLTKRTLTRRELFTLSTKVAVATALARRVGFAATENSFHAFGAVVGDSIAAKVGEKVLREGGNAIDAAVAAAFAAGIASPSKSGVGGYGGHAMIALARSNKVTAIDFNSVAEISRVPSISSASTGSISISISTAAFACSLIGSIL